MIGSVVKSIPHKQNLNFIEIKEHIGKSSEEALLVEPSEPGSGLQILDNSIDDKSPSLNMVLHT